MANEINISVSMGASKNDAQVTASHSKTLDMTGDDMTSHTQLIGQAAAEALDLDELASCGVLCIKNVDADNYIELALDNGMSNKFLKLRPGACCLFEPATTTIYAKANVADVRVVISAVEV